MKISAPVIGLFIALFLLSCSGENKQIIERYEDGSPKLIRVFEGHGKDKKKIRELLLWNNGNTKKDIAYDGNKKQGTYYSYYENSVLEAEKQYYLNRENGVQRFWHENGQLKYEYTAVYGLISGKKTMWYDNGKIEEDRFFIDGQENGMQRGWFDNGQKEFEYEAIEGQKNGQFSKWFRNGQKEIEFSCVKDTVDEHLTAWYMNGIKRLEFNFKNFKFEGAQKSWDGDGNLIYHFENYLQDSTKSKQRVHFGNYETWLSDHWELIKYVFDKYGLVSAIK